MAKFDVDGDLVRKLAGLLEETGLGEIEFEAADCRIRVARPGGLAAVAAPVVATPMAEPLAAVVAAPVAGDPGSVTSPMVGTIYLSPSPEEPPFVALGDSVVAGQTLMLVEAMKTFNEISAPMAGKVTEILVESGQPVEFGEVLAKVG